MYTRYLASCVFYLSGHLSDPPYPRRGRDERSPCETCQGEPAEEAHGTAGEPGDGAGLGRGQWHEQHHHGDDWPCPAGRRRSPGLARERAGRGRPTRSSRPSAAPLPPMGHGRGIEGGGQRDAARAAEQEQHEHDDRVVAALEQPAVQADGHDRGQLVPGAESRRRATWPPATTPSPIGPMTATSSPHEREQHVAEDRGEHERERRLGAPVGRRARRCARGMLRGGGLAPAWRALAWARRSSRRARSSGRACAAASHSRALGDVRGDSAPQFLQTTKRSGQWPSASDDRRRAEVPRPLSEVAAAEAPPPPKSPPPKPAATKVPATEVPAADVAVIGAVGGARRTSTRSAGRRAARGRSRRTHRRSSRRPTRPSTGRRGRRRPRCGPRAPRRPPGAWRTPRTPAPGAPRRRAARSRRRGPTARGAGRRSRARAARAARGPRGGHGRPPSRSDRRPPSRPRSRSSATVPDVRSVRSARS